MKKYECMLKMEKSRKIFVKNNIELFQFELVNVKASVMDILLI
jgi:hypothetical protein